YAMKVAPTVRAGGKGNDNFKPLPICIIKEDKKISVFYERIIQFNSSIRACFDNLFSKHALCIYLSKFFVLV
ncbi:hypothetical protein SB775_17740, partial [Peribacillus sp. SIMBA_075]